MSSVRSGETVKLKLYVCNLQAIVIYQRFSRFRGIVRSEMVYLCTCLHCTFAGTVNVSVFQLDSDSV